MKLFYKTGFGLANRKRLGDNEIKEVTSRRRRKLELILALLRNRDKEKGGISKYSRSEEARKDRNIDWVWGSGSKSPKKK